MLGDDGAAVSIQTWDWYDHLADSWLAWTIEHPDYTVVQTVTEFGILGKIGVNSHGVGVHLNILHHVADGGPIGVPVHVLARTVLDRCADVRDAAVLLGGAHASASSVLTLVGCADDGATALAAEVSPVGTRFVLPGRDGVLVHTNHFLDRHLAAGDREPVVGADSCLRIDVLGRRLARNAPTTIDGLREAMVSHLGGSGAVCCHSAPDDPMGDRWQTLATVGIDVRARSLLVRPGGPCDASATWHALTATLKTPA